VDPTSKLLSPNIIPTRKLTCVWRWGAQAGGQGVVGWKGGKVGCLESGVRGCTIPAPNIGSRVVRSCSTFRSVVRRTWPGWKVHHWAWRSLIWRIVVCRRVPNPRPGVAVVSNPLVVLLLGLGFGSVAVTRRWITTQRRAWIVSLWNERERVRWDFPRCQ